jgi:hypothetical protein
VHAVRRQHCNFAASYVQAGSAVCCMQNHSCTSYHACGCLLRKADTYKAADVGCTASLTQHETPCTDCSCCNTARHGKEVLLPHAVCRATLCSRCTTLLRTLLPPLPPLPCAPPRSAHASLPASYQLRACAQPPAAAHHIRAQQLVSARLVLQLHSILSASHTCRTAVQNKPLEKQYLTPSRASTCTLCLSKPCRS